MLDYAKGIRIYEWLVHSCLPIYAFQIYENTGKLFTSYNRQREISSHGSIVHIRQNLVSRSYGNFGILLNIYVAFNYLLSTTYNLILVQHAFSAPPSLSFKLYQSKNIKLHQLSGHCRQEENLNQGGAASKRALYTSA
ncbi:hypothetical protein CANARDRAFT_174148 [[Candida] arabinofermentans NRRL YB-2248]|uniref:Uncharacterized protein n=1 Tax=[Candida] arabinofermentans NRRL YB-2248 TaxID=983967 RepID=A0A1E4T962_9ASCO|nr:hypothetical protein CANARDRAFT_174148 [[Candida] arabinofermentans NRRL YB-2248]